MSSQTHRPQNHFCNGAWKGCATSAAHRVLRRGPQPRAGYGSDLAGLATWSETGFKFLCCKMHKKLRKMVQIQNHFCYIG